MRIDFKLIKNTQVLSGLFFLIALFFMQSGFAQNAPVAFEMQNNMAAQKVYGQTDFTSNGAATTQSRMDRTSQTAIDPTTGKVFISGRDNNRILRFASIDRYQNGEAAEAVLGQPNFTTSTASNAINGLNTPNGIFVDNTGILWVADFSNHRVLRFNDASTKVNGANADGVLGQSNFSNNLANRGLIFSAAANTMDSPISLYVESDGTLWVGDGMNNRLLRFDNAALQANGADADGVLGQADFTSNSTGTSQSAMYFPSGVTVDNSGRLYLADALNDRVLWWNNAKGKTNGANADGLLGQSSYTGNTSGVAQNKFSSVNHVSVDPKGRFLAVTDANNQRVLIFLRPGQQSGLVDADYVLGQPNFTSTTINNGGVSATSLFAPRGNFIYQTANFETLLYTADYVNNRVKLHVLFDEINIDANTALNNTPVSDSLQATELDGDALTFTILSNTAKGTTVLDNATSGDYTYTPVAVTSDYIDSLSYSVCDIDGCDTSVVYFNVAASKRAPVAFEMQNNMAAQKVYGQPDFTSSLSATTQTGLFQPYQTAVDPTTEKVFVVDYLNSRVLRYASIDTYQNGYAAEAVLGQPNFTTSTASAAINRMSLPSGIFVDTTGRLWVADYGNSRVLRFDNASTKVNGADADGVLGQSTFTSGLANRGGSVSANTMFYPTSVYIESDGTLWVADGINNRILRFDNASSKGNGANADGVLGQSTFTSSIPTVSQSGIDYPTGLTVDNSGRLYIVEYHNNRVLWWNDAQSKTNGANADGLLGQSSYTLNLAGLGQNKFTTPSKLSVDPSGRFLAVTDYSLHRVLIFLNPGQQSGLVDADYVLGQPNFTSVTPSNGGISATSIFSPRGVFIYETANETLMFIAEEGINRVKLHVLFDEINIDANTALNNTPVSGSLQATELDGDALTFTILSNTAKGTTVLDNATSGDYTYTPVAVTSDYIDSLSYSVCDIDGCDTSVVYFNVAASKRAPVAFEMQNNMAPQKVYGQTDFTSSSGGLTQSKQNFPYQTAIDPTTGKVFISERDNNRILRFASIDRYQNGEAAEAVLGQPNFTTSTFSNTINKLTEPNGIFVDNTGILWVADHANHRVLRFNDASTKANGANADGVLGQSNFTDNLANRGFIVSAPANTMDNPRDLYVESDGTLWVADSRNNRILRFDSASTKTNGADADGVLGQADFTSSSSGTSQSAINLPTGVTVDNNGRLYIGDYNNKRVLWWNDAKSKTNGANADGLLGQDLYTTNTLGVAQNKFYNVDHVSVDPKGRFLAVSNAHSHRVLIFLRPGQQSGLVDADYVLGQSDFTSSGFNSGGGFSANATGLFSPRGNFIYQTANFETLLYTADYENNRVKLHSLLDDINTDGYTPVSNTLQATELDGDALTFTILSTTTNGTTVLDNAVTGDYTYTPIAVINTYSDTLTYSVCDMDGCDTSVVYFAVEGDPGKSPPVAFEMQNNMAAQKVYGQTDFTSGLSGTTQSKQNLPQQTAIDPTTGKVFISEYWNHRVLRFASIDRYQNGEAAEAVLGQANFTTAIGSTTINGLYGPSGIFVDNAGSLWVADYLNARVVRFDNASTKLNGANADGVLGQSNFTDGVINRGGAINANTMHRPIDVHVEPDGTLWVADRNNKRILRFDNAAGLTDGSNADGVLGEANFTLSSSGPSQSITSFLNAITIDNNGRLYAVDEGNNRILWWDDAKSKANGDNADGLLGQDSYTTNTIGTTQNKFDNPRMLSVDPKGRFLVVSEINNNRVLIFLNPGQQSGLVNADYVLGQPDFTSSAANNGGVVSATSLSGAFGSYIHQTTNFETLLYIADYNNNRVKLHSLLDEITTDGYTPVSDTLHATELDGDALTFAIISNTANGTTVLDNAVTGDYTYTPVAAATSYTDTLTYSVCDIDGCDTSVVYFAVEVSTKRAPIAFEMQNNMAAQKVYGQPDFTSSGTATTQTGMNYPYKTAIDPTTGKVFVADLFNHRILRFTSIDRYQNGEAAEAVLGQPNFTTVTASTAINGLNRPAGIFVDNAGRLWVTDFFNHRVLRFDNASTKVNGANADGVLGQGDFVSSSANRGVAMSANSMDGPLSLHVESDGTLWVLDRSNHRVLRFDNASAKLNGANADGVLGQAIFTSRPIGTSQSKIDWPNGITVDNNGRLYLADENNNRILWWNNAKGKVNGANADGLLGQSSYTDNTSGLNTNKFNVPTKLTVDPKGRFLTVSDGGNKRVLVFLNPGIQSGLVNADYVLGQADFNTGTAGGPSATSINDPRGNFIYQTANFETLLYLADASNNRVKLHSLFDEYTTDGNTPVSNTLQATELDGDALTFAIISNTSNGTTVLDNAVTGDYTYTPVAAAIAYTDTLTYSVCDIDGCDTSVVYFAVEASTKRAPIAFEMQNNMAAQKVYGQTDFTSNGAVTTQSGLRYPQHTAIDPTTEKVFISDVFNHRILRYASIDRYQNGEAAEAVLGQANFITKTASSTINGFDQSMGIFVDNTGTLWVTDCNNNRVVRFDNASTKANEANADGVLGQSNFTDNLVNQGGTVNASTMKNPKALYVESDGTLWVADQGNSRVLRFDNAAGMSNGANANAVLGQINLTSNANGNSQSTIHFPTGVTVDNSGRLYITDLTNNRVLWWNDAKSKTNGANADGLLGQDLYTENTSGLDTNKLNYPVGLSVDPKGRYLAVSDVNNNRVLIFLNPGLQSGLVNADYVLGQPDFTSGTANNGGALSATSINGPRGNFIYQTANFETLLFVADRSNSRVKLYSLLDDNNTISSTPFSDTLDATETDGDTLTFAILSNTSNGITVLNNAATGDYTYTPVAAASNYTDSLSYSVCDIDGCDTSVVYFTVETAIIWNGTGWSNGQSLIVTGGPSNNSQDSIKTMLIQAGDTAYIAEAIRVGSLTLEANAQLVVNPGNCMTVLDSTNIDPTAGVLLSSNSETAYGQYIGPVMDNTTVEMTLNNYGWHQLASPISGKVLADISLINSLGNPGNLIYAYSSVVEYGDTSQFRIYDTQAYRGDYASSFAETDSLNIGYGNDVGYTNAYGTWFGGMSTDAFDGTVGCMLYVNATVTDDTPLPVTISVTGTTNDAIKTTITNVDNYGWNMVSNPYPTAIDWEAIEERLDLVPATTGKFNNTISIWEPAVQNYAIYMAEDGSGTNGTSVNGTSATLSQGARYIAPFQAFWVQRTDFETENSGLSTPINLDIEPADRANCESPKHFKMAAPTERVRLRLSNDSNEYTDELVINFREDYTTELSMDKDAYKIPSINQEVALLMTRVEDKNLVIHGRNLPESGCSIPLLIEAKLGKNLELDLTEVPEGYTVWLEEIATGNYYPLNDAPFNYTNFKRGLNHSFNLVFRTSNEQPNPVGLNYNMEGESLLLEFEQAGVDKQLFIEDILGRALYTRSLNAGEKQLEIDISGWAKQSYLIRVVSGDKVSVTRLVF